ncbi:MAG: thioredoxin domain-containing protein [Verrucomicrobiota bacterium]
MADFWRKGVALMGILAWVSGVHGEDEKRENRLAREKSPYLLQHRHNPVDWYPWGEEAFEKAREEGKVILLSIGYSTCHWCHVMERESFMDEEVAKFLNEHFVSIKLDREERPDVDAVYMQSFQAMMGQGGGWPLNVFLTPDLKMFYGGTYFPPKSRGGRPSFMRTLEGIERTWREEREKVRESAEKLTEQLPLHLERGKGEEGELSLETVAAAVRLVAGQVDEEEGGWGMGQKFPQASHLKLILFSDDEEARERALFTCRKMALGGIHDQLGGGFHRYTVDRIWLVPHFEKMLSDQAQLLEIFVEAWRQTGEDLFAEAARGIGEYVRVEMQDEAGGYYSAQDAQSEGKEGKYWCWTTAELGEFLSSEERVVVERVFGMSEQGNFEDFSDPEALKNQNVLSIVGEVGEDGEVFEAAVAKMKVERAKRVPPMTDDKILAGWNGLMIGAMAAAGRILDEPRYVRSAERAWEFVVSKLWDGERLANRWREGEVEGSQLGSNYLAMARAGRLLYSATLEVGYLEQGIAFLDGARAGFFDEEKGGFFEGGEGADLVMRLKDDFDSAVPTTTSLGVAELVLFAEMTGREDLVREAEKTFEYFGKTLREEAMSLPGLVRALEASLEKPGRLVIAGEGEEREAFLRAGWEAGGSELLVMGNEGPVSEFTRSLQAVDGVTVYYCKGQACREPTNEVEKVRSFLKE